MYFVVQPCVFAPLRLFLLKNQFVVFHRHFDFVSRLELPFEQFHGERIQQLLLHGAFKRARAELLVVAFLGQQFLRGGDRECYGVVTLRR